MKEVADRLAAIGSPIAEEDQLVSLLGSLPRSYYTIVTALEARGADNLSLSFVQQAPINEELKLEGNGQQSQALLGTRKPTNRFAKRKQGPRLCYNCGEAGHFHFQQNCPKPKKNEATKQNPCHKVKAAGEKLETETDTDGNADASGIHLQES